MLIIGHRGCSYKGFNQNTIRCYKKIIEEGAKAFEFDVQLTKDNHLVVVHNLNLSKVSNGSGYIAQTTLEEIKKLLAGSLKNGKDPIPTLIDVLDLVSSYSKEVRPTMHLELKGDNTGLLTAKIIKDYIDKRLVDLDDFLISSFNWAELDSFKSYCPDIKIALLDGSIRRKDLVKKLVSSPDIFSRIFAYGEEDYMIPISSNLEDSIQLINQEVENDADKELLINEVKSALNGEYYTDSLIDEALKRKAFSLNLWYKTVSKEFIEKAHSKGLKVFLYTVNEKEDIKNIKFLKPDGFFTDYYIETKEYFESL